MQRRADRAVAARGGGRRGRLGVVVAAAALCLAVAGCGVKGPPELPEGVKDTKPFPRAYPQAEWPVVPGARPAAPAQQPAPGGGTGRP